MADNNKSILTGWENASFLPRNEMVFANRNKSYGAYIIRMLYTKRVIAGFLIAFAFILVMVFFPLIAAMLNNATDDAKLTKEVTIDLTAPPPIDPNEPPPPPPPPPPPVAQTIKFVPPVVVDKPVEDEQPPPQEKLSETTVAAVTQEGDPNAEQAPPDVPVEDPDAGKIFTIVEEMPTFPGGEAGLVKYLQDHIKYPAMARENGIEGIVYVTFVVDKDGKVKDAKLLRGKNGLDDEALRVINAMPDWKPGRQNGRNVAVQYNLPVNFRLK